MSLMKPTPGEMLDRMTILELKINAFEKAGRDLKPLRDEYHEIYSALFSSDGFPKAYASLKSEILQINTLIWNAEDLMRSLDEGEHRKLAEVGKCIARWNDLRASLVRKVDKEFKVDSVSEKIYSKSRPSTRA